VVTAVFLDPHTCATLYVLGAAVGPDLREGKLDSCPGPPQLGSLHKNSKKIITQGNIKILFKTDNLE